MVGVETFLGDHGLEWVIQLDVVSFSGMLEGLDDLGLEFLLI